MSYYELNELSEPSAPPVDQASVADDVPDLDSYQRVVIFFSGGKDGLACLLDLLDRGVPREKIELHHHNVDGEALPGEEGLMDWPVTLAYCEALAKAFGVQFTTSYREGGIEREMLRENTRTAPVVFYKKGVRVQTGGTNGPLGTRRMFPQQSASLSTRWCSAAAKVDVGVAYLRNDEKFRNCRTLVITGERAEKSTARAKYASFEVDRADLRHGAVARHIDHWRSVKSWTEKQVWAIIERYRVAPHPCYPLGWGRASCLFCIFGNKNQWASARVVSPHGFAKIDGYERDFGVTINRQMSVTALADKGTPYPETANADLVRIAMSRTYDLPIFVDNWTLPAGAYGECSGPT